LDTIYLIAISTEVKCNETRSSQGLT